MGTLLPTNTKHTESPDAIDTQGVLPNEIHRVLLDVRLEFSEELIMTSVLGADFGS